MEGGGGGVNTMMGRKNNQQTVKRNNPCGFANELNRFYAKFDVTDFSSERDTVCRSLVPSPMCVEEGDVIFFLDSNPLRPQVRMALSV